MRTSSFTKHTETESTISWAVREIVRDAGGRPRLFLRLELSGVQFQARAARAFMRVGEVESSFVRFSPAFERAFAYFEQPLPERGRIVFGYDQQVTLEIHDPYARELTDRLDRTRLPSNITVYGKSP